MTSTRGNASTPSGRPPLLGGWGYIGEAEVDAQGRTELDRRQTEHHQRLVAILDAPLPPLPLEVPLYCSRPRADGASAPGAAAPEVVAGGQRPDLVLGMGQYNFRMRDAYRLALAAAIDEPLPSVMMTTAFSGLHLYSRAQLAGTQRCLGVFLKWPGDDAERLAKLDGKISRVIADINARRCPPLLELNVIKAFPPAPSLSPTAAARSADGSRAASGKLPAIMLEMVEDTAKQLERLSSHYKVLVVHRGPGLNMTGAANVNAVVSTSVQADLKRVLSRYHVTPGFLDVDATTAFPVIRDAPWMVGTQDSGSNKVASSPASPERLRVIQLAVARLATAGRMAAVLPPGSAASGGSAQVGSVFPPDGGFAADDDGVGEGSTADVSSRSTFLGKDAAVFVNGRYFGPLMALRRASQTFGTMNAVLHHAHTLTSATLSTRKRRI